MSGKKNRKTHSQEKSSGSPKYQPAGLIYRLPLCQDNNNVLPWKINLTLKSVGTAILCSSENQDNDSQVL